MSERTLLRFRPEGPGRPRQARTAWLHWPALAFRVRAFIPPQRQLDVFEELLLRLGLAGYLRPDDIAELSGLAPELVTLVIGQLAQKGLSDARGPTARGRAALELGEDLAAAEVTLGWMLRCQLSGQVMPLFCEGDLPPAGDPQGRFPVFSLNPLVKTNHPGLRTDFQLALHRWRDLLQLADAGDRRDEDHDMHAFPLDADEAEPDAQPLERPAVAGASLPTREERLVVELFDEPPRAVAVRLLAYLPQDPHLGTVRAEGLLIRHPFGIPGGDWYLQQLEVNLPRLGRSGEEIRRWAKTARESREKRLRADGVTLADLKPLGKQRMLDLVGSVDSLHEALVVPLELVGEALVLAATRPERLDELRAKTCTVLEILFDEWLVRFGAHRQPPSTWATTRAERESYVRAAAAALGLSSVPQVFLELEEAGLRRAVTGKGDLRDRIALALVDAATRPGGAHPLRLALQNDPLLIDRLDELRRTRNRSVHYRRGQRAERPDSAAAATAIAQVEGSLTALVGAWRTALQPTEDSIALDL